ncbi:hypothetical protein D1007_03496 [Hordeum vulgare]|nr:hypothetical protein D1007_03496 [Hordeum vulgare]
MVLEHVDHPSKLGLVPFVDTDFEEEEENEDMLVEQEYNDEGMPQIECNRDNPNLNAGAVYKNMAKLWNALTMYCIQNNNVYGTKKNEKRKLTVHCPDPRCSWKLHATRMHGKKTIKTRYNNNAHTCPPKVETHISKLATKNWLAEDVPPCNHFEWMDEYIEMLQMEGLIDSTGAAKMVLDLRSAWKTMGVADILCYDSVAPTMGDAELKGELKVLNKHLMKMIDLTKQANLIAVPFYLCIVALGFPYLLIIGR